MRPFHAGALFLLIALSLSVLASHLHPAEPPPAQTPPVRTVLFFGDSLTAGYGLDDPALAFPGRIQEKIDAEKLPWRVVNAGLSGETTAGGLRRLEWIMRQPVHVFVLELGANDGLRGLPPDVARANLQRIVDRVRAKNPATRVLIAGMEMPTSMGADYTASFRAIYPELAKRNDATLIPFLLAGVGGDPQLNLPDGIHPNAQGHARVADTVWKTLRPLLVAAPNPP